MPNNIYMTLQDADAYFERITRSPDQTFEIYEADAIRNILAATVSGYPTFVEGTFGHVIAVMPLGPGCKVTVRPNDIPPSPRCRCAAVAIPNRHQESNMNKVFEAVIVKQNPTTNEPVEVVSVVGPFVAANETAAQKQVIVDYCQATGIQGKDAANLQVRLRTFSEG